MSPEIQKHIGRFWSKDNVTCFEIEDEGHIQYSHFPDDGPNAIWKEDFDRLLTQAAIKLNTTQEEILKRLDSGEKIKW